MVELFQAIMGKARPLVCSRSIITKLVCTRHP